MSPALALLMLTEFNLGDWLMRGLAVIGAAALGGILAGLAVQLSARSMAARKAPPGLVRFMRIGGALTVGIIVALLMFRGGGPGGGGSGTGGGEGADIGKLTGDQDKDTAKAKDQPHSKGTPTEKEAVEIEVLLGNSESKGRHYRVQGESKLRTLEEIKELLAERKKKEPPLGKVTIVVYKNSPDRNTLIVRNLVTLVEENNLTPDISQPMRDAP